MVTKIEPAQTRRSTAAIAGIASGSLWLVVAALSIAATISENQSGDFDGAERLLWGTMTIVVVAAGLLLIAFLNGLRHELGLRAIGVVGLVFGALGTAAGVVVWAYPLWGSLLGIASALFAIPLLRRGEAPRWASTTFGFGMLAGVAVFLLLDAMQFGPIDSYGDYQLAYEIGLLAVLVTSGVGLIGVGRWLHTG